MRLVSAGQWSADPAELWELDHGGARAGRRFEPVAERELEADLRHMATKLSSSSSTTIGVAEFVGPNGIADYIAVTRSVEGLARRLDARIDLVRTPGDARFLNQVAVRRGLHPSTLSKRSGAGLQQTRRTVSRMLDKRWLLQQGDLIFRNPVLTPIGKMYAFEAKVSDWRRALAQASRYSTWADAAAIVLLKQPRDLDLAISAVKSLRLGLALGTKWIVRPTYKRNTSGLRLFASEAFVQSAAKSRGDHSPSGKA